MAAVNERRTGLHDVRLILHDLPFAKVLVNVLGSFANPFGALTMIDWRVPESGITRIVVPRVLLVFFG